MPIYKNLPHEKKNFDSSASFQEKFFQYAYQAKGIALPFLIISSALLVIYVGINIYTSRYETHASQLMDKKSWQEVVDHYPRSQSADMARIYLGKSALDEKQYDTAINYYHAVVEDKKADRMLRSGAEQNLALAYLKKGDSSQAISILEKASKESENPTADYSKLLLAQVYEVKGDVSQAQSVYKSLSESQDSAVKESAKQRLEWLNPPSTPESK